jgi:hypothetical protein
MEVTNSEVTELVRLLTDLARQRFYGEVVVKFESGRVTTVRKTETLKPGHLAWGSHRDNRGQQDGQR